MVLKSWFRSSAKGEASKPEEQGPTIEDLIVLERYDEAEARLKAELKEDPDDLHAHLKLAEVYTGLARGADAADQYLFVAEEYAKDGFYDKGIALLSKAMKLSPADEGLRHKHYAFERAKGLDHKRQAALEGVRQSRHAGGATGTRLLQVQRAWHHLAPTPLVARLSPDGLRRLFAAGEVVRWPAGSVVARRGEAEPAALAVVLAGALEAVIGKAGGGETTVRAFGAGDVLGETVLFSRAPWPATYRVSEEASALQLDRAGLEHSLAGNPDPVSYLDGLRSDGHDAEIYRIVGRLEAPR
ncbi:MAG TPA: cyclic nucleotide-binding domain-containing protein [Thermoanaerobaculia bacterium]|nr:cyclic nucleotide-binding domain-containing protein [Thermoanaerobaculia bacterium]